MGNSGHGIIILIRLVYWNNYRDICMLFYFLSANFMLLSKIFCVIPSLSHTCTKYWRRIAADLIDPFVLDAVFNLPSSYTLSILRIMRSVPPQWHFNCLTAGWSLLSKYMWTSTVLTAEPILMGLSLSVNYFISNSGPPILCFRAKYVASFFRPHTRTCKIRRRSDRSLRLGCRDQPSKFMCSFDSSYCEVSFACQLQFTGNPQVRPAHSSPR